MDAPSESDIGTTLALEFPIADVLVSRAMPDSDDAVLAEVLSAPTDEDFEQRAWEFGYFVSRMSGTPRAHLQAKGVPAFSVALMSGEGDHQLVVNGLPTLLATTRERKHLDMYFLTPPMARALTGSGYWTSKLVLAAAA